MSQIKRGKEAKYDVDDQNFQQRTYIKREKTYMTTSTQHDAQPGQKISIDSNVYKMNIFLPHGADPQ